MVKIKKKQFHGHLNKQRRQKFKRQKIQKQIGIKQPGQKWHKNEKMDQEISENGQQEQKRKNPHIKFEKQPQEGGEHHNPNIKQQSPTPTTISKSINRPQGKQPLVQHESFGKWYEYQFDEKLPISENGELQKLDNNLIEQTQQRAEELMRKDMEQFAQWHRLRNRGDADWLETIAQKGTFADRLSALQLGVQRSPVHALQQLRSFVELVHRKGAKIRQAHSVTKALKELFINDLLPPNRKLLLFNQRPLDNWAKQKGPEVDKRLILWQFEAQLKQVYRQFLDGIQELAGNMVEGIAQAACQELADLLTERPEQEQSLLTSLVNKLGHPLHRVGAKVAQMLEQLVRKHPNMRSVVAKEVEQLMFRKNISPRAQRYALHFLSRMLMDAGEFDLALQLIQVYLRLFRILVLKDALNEHKLFPLLIIGLNRAFPYAKGKASLDSQLLEDVQSLYAIVQTAKFSTALSVLRLLFQIHSTSEGISDRFYCAFYRRLLNLPTNGGTQQLGPFFDLLQRVLKNDLVESRVRAFIKRLFQVALASNSAFAASALITCHMIVKERPQLLRLDKTLNEKILESRDRPDESRNKPAKRGKKTSKSVEVKKEEPKEEEQRNRAETLKQKLQWFEENEGGNEEEDEDEVEHYEDVMTESDKDEKNNVKKEIEVKTGWVHRQIPMMNGFAIPTHKHDQQQKPTTSAIVAPIQRPPHVNGQLRRKNAYDPAARNPLFAGADFALDMELYILARHYHPTVATFARALIRGDPIHYKGDPLVDLSYMRFLDRFAFKNPKKRHLSADGKEAKKTLFGNSYTPKGVKALNPASREYASKKNSEIPVDERFLHHFAALKFNKESKDKKKKEKKEKNDEDDEMASLNSDEFDILLEKFEPGESRDNFDVDFTAAFGEEADTKRKQKAMKRRRADEMNEDYDENEEGGLAGSDIDSSEFDDEDENEADDGDDEEEGGEYDDDDDENEELIFDENGDQEQDDDGEDEELDSDVDVRDFDDDEFDQEDNENDDEEEEEEDELEFD